MALIIDFSKSTEEFGDNTASGSSHVRSVLTNSLFPASIYNYFRMINIKFPGHFFLKLYEKS